jgi:hypothetical protein
MTRLVSALGALLLASSVAIGVTVPTSGSDAGTASVQAGDGHWCC